MINQHHIKALTIGITFCNMICLWVYGYLMAAANWQEVGWVHWRTVHDGCIDLGHYCGEEMQH